MKNFIHKIFLSVNSILATGAGLIFPQPKNASLIHTVSAQDLSKLPHSPFPYALWQYNHPLVKEIVWQIKYYDNTALVEKIAPHLTAVIEQEILSKRPYTRIALVPVPLSKNRRRERGYNQAEYLSEALYSTIKSNIQHISHETKLIHKSIHTESQTHKNKQERLINLKNSFALLSHTIHTDTLIIIVDDVITTGATTEEISRLLRNAGFKNIEKIALAH